MGGSKKMQQVRSIANRPQGGGNKKQGLPPSIGRPGWLSNFIRTSAGGYFRDIPAGLVDPCPTKEVVDDQTVANQTAADALRGVTKINGSLLITGNITDLSPFNCLKEVTGNIVFNSVVLSSDGLLAQTISGFNNLAKVGGGMVFNSNPNLKTISGFNNLANVGGDLGDVGVVVAQNPELIEISGFNNLAKVGGDMGFSVNPNLKTISGFNNLAKVGGGMGFGVNPNLKKISGFNNLAKVGGEMGFISNLNLKTISGFRNLINVGKSVGGDLGDVGVVVAHNPELIEISGFGNLETVEGSIIIAECTSLTNASGLRNVASVGGEFSCTNNTEFTNTAFATLVTSLKTIGGNINVNNNSGTNWALPDVWKDMTKLNWGVNAVDRKLNDATDPDSLGNFSAAAGRELFDLPDKNGN